MKVREATLAEIVPPEPKLRELSPRQLRSEKASS